MKTRLTLPVLAACAALLAAPDARAGIADSPLPVLSPDATTSHLYSVPGVIRVKIPPQSSPKIPPSL